MELGSIRLHPVFLACLCIALLHPLNAFASPFEKGVELFEVGAVPPPFDSYPRLAESAAGFQCDIVRVFGSIVSIKNCQPIVFRSIGRLVWSNQQLSDAVGKRYSPDDIELTFWQEQGWKILLAGLLVLISLFWGGIIYRLRVRD